MHGGQPVCEGPRTERYKDLETVSSACLSQLLLWKDTWEGTTFLWASKGLKAHEGEEKGTQATAGQSNASERIALHDDIVYCRKPIFFSHKYTFQLYWPSSYKIIVWGNTSRLKDLWGGLVSEEQGKGKEKGRKGKKANTKWPVGFQEQHDQMKKSSRRDQMKKQGVLWLFRMPCCSLKMLILLLPSLGFRGLFLSDTVSDNSARGWKSQINGTCHFSGFWYFIQKPWTPFEKQKMIQQRTCI